MDGEHSGMVLTMVRPTAIAVGLTMPPNWTDGLKRSGATSEIRPL